MFSERIRSISTNRACFRLLTLGCSAAILQSIKPERPTAKGNTERVSGVGSPPPPGPLGVRLFPPRSRHKDYYFDYFSS